MAGEDWFAQYGDPGGGGAPAGGGDWFGQFGPAQPPGTPRTGGYAGDQQGLPAGGGASVPGVDPRALAVIRAYQAANPTSTTPAGAIAALKAAGIDASPYLYGQTPSGNEINLPGYGKFKVLNEGSNTPYFGENDSPGGGGGDGGRQAPGAAGYDPGYSDRLGYNGIETDPGYQFRLSEGAKALEHSAAAKGTLLTGGTLKGLARYAQDYASGEFQNRYQRLLGEQQNRYNQLSGLAGFGANAAAGQGGANTGYANQAGDLLTQQANARAAGTVGGANAWNQPIAQGANLAQMYWLSRLYGPQGTTGGGGGGAWDAGGTFTGPSTFG